MSNLLVIPSIDIKDRKTVRVVKGIPEVQSEDYGNDPVETAMLWRAENAKIIHVVDFDLSQEHSLKNIDIVKEICDSVVIPVEFGGGISTAKDVELAFDSGVYRIVIGSLAYDQPLLFSELIKTYGAIRISAAVDVIDNEVVIHGRKERTGLNPVEYSKRLIDLGAERLIVTDVNRNGMLSGPNVELSRMIAEATGVKVTHSGGVSCYADLHCIDENCDAGIDSVIIGRALYENKFPCQSLWRLAESGLFN
ncbi:MAG: 1-(5-phosphoribosyl)-5-[(5-phosphoribosylamino)methylideneamino] imidazole-4-carboxamide isomerase [Ignavibacteria bacterium]|nr:MAG: 1-(5-phosphoribosyl)-5-[(5-phosphoribosylamino)methylideneamino] imidazole-4-carboxamide isomerase [Ignavibacteria bacterium]